MRRGLVVGLAAASSSFALTAHAGASPDVRYGIQDDAWLLYGEGTLENRIETLDRLGVDLVRFTIDWSTVEARRGTRDWSRVDPVLRGLRARGVRVVATLYGTPRWANGGRSANWAPASGSTFASFAGAAAARYPWVKDWLIWNEPNQRRWLQPTTPSTYVTKLLNPAYWAIHRASAGVRVGGRGRHGSARLQRRCLTRRLDSGDACRPCTAGRLRASPLSALTAPGRPGRR